jgi:hypothetical protein
LSYEANKGVGMDTNKICLAMADLWLELGGDTEGFLNCWFIIFNIISKKEGKNV